MTKFQIDDKVVKKGTARPVYKIISNVVKPGIPYTTDPTSYIVVDIAPKNMIGGGVDRITVHEDEIELFSPIK